MKMFKTLKKFLGNPAATPGSESSTPESGPVQRTGFPGPQDLAGAQTPEGQRAARMPLQPNEEAPPGLRRRVLFLSGSADRRLAFEQALSSGRAKWTVVTFGSAESALQMLATKPFDAIIVETGFAGINPAVFMNEAARSCPSALRFVRSATADEALPSGLQGEPPQRLVGYLSADAVEEALERAFLLKSWIASSAIRSLLPQLRVLPAVPALYTQVVSELRTPDASLEVVANLIAKDPVMTARMLQVANSAYFALAEPVSRAVDAVIFLGSDRTKALILAGHVFSQFEAVTCPGYSFEREWRHSLEVATLAQTIVRAETQDSRQADQGFVAGLLHDIGKCLLAANVPERYSKVLERARAENLPPVEVESGVFETTHAELGACLLGLWGLPEGVLEAVAWHHYPARSSDQRFSLLTAVHVANALAYERIPAAGDSGAAGVTLDVDYLRSIGLSERRNRWREVCGGAIRPAEEGQWAKVQERRDAKAR